jgi:hypothetical protein
MLVDDIFLVDNIVLVAFPERDVEEPVELQQEGCEIIFYDLDGAKVSQYSTFTEITPILDVQFESVETGCGGFSVTFDHRLTEVSRGFQVDIHIFGERTPRYTGKLMEMPEPGSTKNTWEYQGHGFFDDLEYCEVHRTYINVEVAAIVNDIMKQDIQPFTRIAYDGTQIEQPVPPYKCVFLEFNRVSAKEALSELGDYAQNYQWGVGPGRTFFFKRINPNVVQDATKWVGRHLRVYRPESDISRIVNAITVLSGEINPATDDNFATDMTEPLSIADYGRRWKKMTIPSALNIADAERWGQQQLDAQAWPIESAKALNIELFQRDKIEARGKARIYDKDGVAYELPIKRATYKLRGGKIVCDVNLGKLDYVPMDEEYVKMNRRLKTLEVLEQLNTKGTA